MPKKRIGIVSDHAGKELRVSIVDFLKLQDETVVDYGVDLGSQQAVDYPDCAAALAKDISEQKLPLGIAICGTGIGMAIVANKFPGVRAAVVFDEYTTKMSKKHNYVNMLCLGARVLNPFRAVDLVRLWMETEFEGGRHNPRIRKILEIEKNNFSIYRQK